MSRPGVASKSQRHTGKDAEEFADEARRILKAEMARRGFSFKQLATALNELGDAETESAQTLINKVNRGRFTFAFMLRASRAMGARSLDVAPLRDGVAGTPIGAGE